MEKRCAREAERKKNSRRYYIIGELVAKYFPEFQRFEPGTKAENAVEFKPLETFLSVLSTDQELMVRLKEMVNHRQSLQNDIWFFIAAHLHIERLYLDLGGEFYYGII